MKAEFNTIDKAFDWLMAQPKYYQRMGKTSLQSCEIKMNYKNGTMSYGRKVKLLEKYGFEITLTLNEDE